MTSNIPSPSKKKRAIFLDRDGVINDIVDRGENCIVQGKKVRWTAPWTYTEFHLKTGVSELLQLIKNAGYLVILATNQPDITYGTMKREDHEKIMSDIRFLPFDDIFVCEHGRNDDCSCKKPLPGLLFSAAQKWDIDLSVSYLVGDTKSDAGAAQAAGCRLILISGIYNQDVEAEDRVKDLNEIIQIIRQ